VGSIALGVLQEAGLVARLDGSTVDALDFATPPIVLTALGVLNALVVGAFRRSLGRAATSEHDYQEIFNATHEAILLLEPASGRIVDANVTASEMFGYTRDELLRLTGPELSAEQGPFHPEAAHAVMKRATTEGPQVFEWLARRQEGREFWVEATVRTTEIGQCKRLLAVVRDAAARKRSEAELRQSEKLQAVGLLAGNVAHDFNNQLMGLMGYAELLRRKAQDSQAVLRYADAILTAASRARSSTARLLSFTRRAPRAGGPVDVHALIREVADLLRRSIGPQVEIVTELAARDSTTVGDATQLQSALLNLGLNARDAMPHGGRLTFRTRDAKLAEGPEGAAGRGSRAYLELEVADTGHGMGAETQARVFEPFFTTRPTGTGIGLAAVAAAVKAQGGRIAVESAPGQGSVFRLWLPSRPPRPGGPGEDAQPPATRFPGLRVLMAEDDPVAADATREMLDGLGCQVTPVADGRAAVERYASDPAAFDVVLLDLLMPRLGGAEALSEIRTLRPQAAAVVMSGFDPQADVKRVLESGAAFLHKPFQSGDLAVALGDVLARAARFSS
jgi:PAS domain S-box-containing protein